MTRKCYQLTFTSPLHLSSGGFALEGIDTFLRSDTLYSALCATAAGFWGNEERLKDFFFPEGSNTSPRFRLSSGFPYFQDILFLPKPYCFTPKVDKSESEKILHSDKKRLHKVRFVDSLLWENMINGKSDEILFNLQKSGSSISFEKNDSPLSSIVDDCWTNQSVTIWEENLHSMEREGHKASHFYKEIERPRVTIDRITSSATIFHFGEIMFRRGAGLYFMADFDKEEDISVFESILTMLGEQGLGADRTVGRGIFDWKEIDSPVTLQSNSGDSFISLSLFVPTEKELDTIDISNSWYDFTLRKGWVSQKELRRRSYRMFTEGSVFKTKTSILPQGKLLKALEKGESTFLNLDHDVWRSGLCFAVPAILPTNP
jgi:CRISPR-associated protein Csm4